MYKLSSKERARVQAARNAPEVISAPGSRNVWFVAMCSVHGNTSHQTPFGCEQCQRERLLAQGLVKP